MIETLKRGWNRETKNMAQNLNNLFQYLVKGKISIVHYTEEILLIILILHLPTMALISMAPKHYNTIGSMTK